MKSIASKRLFLLCFCSIEFGLLAMAFMSFLNNMEIFFRSTVRAVLWTGLGLAIWEKMKSGK